MRLIDVDELIKYFDEDLEGYDNREYILQMLDVKGRIERVKAIPIEWIVKRINYYSDLILKYPNEKELLYSQTELISLLEEWEKENEID